MTCGSEFGDCFPSQPSETILRWVSSNTVYEFEEDLPQTSTCHGQKGASEKKPQAGGEASDIDQTDHSDSNNYLEVEIVQALLRRGKERLDAEDFGDAERLFRNCLTRTTSSLSLSSLHRTSKAEVLVKTYQQQKKRTEAQSILIEKIASGSRNTTGDNSDVLSETLTLAEVLLKKEGHPEALLYARRPLKGYRRMGVSGTAGAGKALQLLVTICHAEGNIDEEEAYTAILSNFIEHKLVSNASNWNGNFQTGSPALVGCATNTQPGASFSSQLPASNLTPEEIREFEEIELERQR